MKQLMNITLLIILVIALSACSANQPTQVVLQPMPQQNQGVQVVPPAQTTADSSGEVATVPNVPPKETTPAENPASADQESVKEFTMTAKRFEFNPGSIVVNQGDHVILHITALDVPHGFAIQEYGINEPLPVGKQVDIDFVADKKGTFTFYCSVPCGSGHRSMKGELVVE